MRQTQLLLYFASKVEKFKFKNQLKFCNQILERHNFVHLIKLFKTTNQQRETFVENKNVFKIVPQFISLVEGLAFHI